MSCSPREPHLLASRWRSRHLWPTPCPWRGSNTPQGPRRSGRPAPPYHRYSRILRFRRPITTHVREENYEIGVVSFCERRFHIILTAEISDVQLIAVSRGGFTFVSK